VARQPIPVSIKTSQSFINYKGGIFSGPCDPVTGQEILHVVTIVGFGSTPEGDDYWLIKNSEGTN